MTHWMCTVCGFLVSVVESPGNCPNCKRVCTFNDVTCYREECGGEQNVDPLLVGATLRAIGSKGGAADDSARQAAASLSKPSEIVPLYRGMKDEQKEKVLALGVKETIPSDTVIFSEGDEALKLYIVEKGRVAIKASLQGGKWAPVCAVSPGEVFGWSCLVPPYRFTASATSLEETVTMSYEASKLRDLFTREPGIGYSMMQNVAELITSRLKNVRLELLGIVYM